MNSKFSWMEFLDAYRIDYVDSGKNVSKGEINIKCPFCNYEDPSEHMALSLEVGKPFWHCWREDSHKGRSPYRLIKKVLNCSHTQVLEILGKDIIDISEFEEILNDFDKFFASEEGFEPYKEDLKMLSDFRPIQNKGATKLFWNYLTNTRGFPRKDVDTIIRRYGLHCAISGYWHNRLIIPIKFNNQLVSWSARTLSNDPNGVRYLSLTDNPEFEEEHGYRAKISIKDTIFNFDKVSNIGGKILFIVEGPLDVINLDYYGQKLDCRAVGLYNMIATTRQKVLLQTLRSNFDDFVILLDKGEDLASFSLQSELSFLPRVTSTDILNDYEASDPAELTKTEIEEICINL